jgi:small nuclear ribonucleoprotein (snRNP)-like protein
MSGLLRGLYGNKVQVVLADGTQITGVLASTDEKFNLALKGIVRDSSLAGTPLEQTNNPNTIRIIRGENVTAVFAA